MYQLATAVFVGGSLVDQGGHNILEPAMFGKPIVFGPHMQNFQEIAETFVTNGAAMQVQSERELDEALLTLMTDPVRRAPLDVNAGRGLVFVSHMGRVYPSGFLPEEAGDVRVQPLPEIYRTAPVFQTLRDPDLLQGRCGQCEFRRVCGGSRSRGSRNAVA